MYHGGGWGAYMRSGDEKPKVTRELLLRVLNYARPYWTQIAGMLVMILLSTGLSLLTPLHLPQHDRRGHSLQGPEPADLAGRGAALHPHPRRRDQRHPAAFELHGRRRRHL